MFNSARLTTIILSVFALGLTLLAPEAEGRVKVKKQVELEAGGNTIGGPGIVKGIPINGFETIYFGGNLNGMTLSATLHCRKGEASLKAETGTVATATFPNINKDKTGTLLFVDVTEFKVECASTSPSSCDCVWRVDRVP